MDDVGVEPCGVFEAVPAVPLPVELRGVSGLVRLLPPPPPAVAGLALTGLSF